MPRKVQLRLVSSVKMTEAGENNVIRFPRRAREYLGFSNSMVVIGKGPYEIGLVVKQAYKQDIQYLAKLIRTGKVSEKEAACVGFVAKSIRDRVTRKKGAQDSIWVSEGVGRITVGADPEFGLINEDGILIRGSQVVPHQGKFGSDGPSVEVRPPPSNDHIQVVRNIAEILENPPSAAEEFEWRGGATFQDPNRIYWFGGHIHLGRPMQISHEFAEPCYEKIATVLDGLLALPMVRFDSPEPWHRRNGCKYGYGKAGDIRTNYPEQDRFEYRVLSGLWLTHPTLAKIALGTAKCIAETAYNRISDSGFDWDWVHEPASRKSLLKTFKLGGIQATKAAINRALPDGISEEGIDNWEKQIRNLDKFDEYKEELNALISLASEPVGRVEPHLSLNIRKNWQEGNPLLPGSSKRLRDTLEAVEAK